MMQPPAVERVDERAQDVFLPDHFGELPGPPLAGEYEITHSEFEVRERARMEVARASHAPAPGITATAAPFRA